MEQSYAYAAFDNQLLQNYHEPEQDNFQQLKAVLQNLAELQATFLNKPHERNKPTISLSEYIKTLEHIKTVDQNQFTKLSEKVQADLDKVLLQKDLLVPKIWALSNNVYINSDLQVLLLQVSSQEYNVPPLLDALLYIFSLSTEHFRQRYFKVLIQNYFKFIKQSLVKTLLDPITDFHTDLQVRILLPVVKVILVSEYNNNSKRNIIDLLNNLANYFQYSLINQEEVYEVLDKKLHSNNYNLITYKLSPLSKKNGHVGEYYLLTVDLNVYGEEKTLEFFCKFLKATINITQEFVKTGGIGKKEDFFYGTLYPLYEKYGLGTLLDFAPKCYLHGVSGNIVLDNLITQGFSELKVNTILSVDALKAILDKLAKYHACTFILEEKLSEESGKPVRLCDNYEKYFAEAMFVYKGAMSEFIDTNFTKLEYILNKFPDLVEKLNMSPNELRETLKDFAYSNLFLAKKSQSIRNVVNHGDMTTGNFLIKYGPNKSVIEGILIDFQYVRYIPPAFEILFFIYLTSSKETRNKHLNHLLDWYYDNLARHLKEFDLGPDKIYSREDFEKNVHQSKPIALSVAFSYATITRYIDPDFREEVMLNQEKFDYHLENYREDIDVCWEKEHYRNTMRGLMEDTVDILKNGFRWDRSQLCLNI